MRKLFVTMFALLAVGFASAQSEVIAKFNEGAKAVQEKVISVVEFTTGIAKAEVNVHVAGIAFDK